MGQKRSNEGKESRESLLRQMVERWRDGGVRQSQHRDGSIASLGNESRQCLEQSSRSSPKIPLVASFLSLYRAYYTGNNNNNNNNNGHNRGNNEQKNHN